MHSVYFCSVVIIIVGIMSLYILYALPRDVFNTRSCAAKQHETHKYKDYLRMKQRNAWLTYIYHGVECLNVVTMVLTEPRNV